MRDAETRPFKSAVAQPDFAVDKSQWECIKENIGVWQGSFMQFSPEGELVKDTPSVLKLEETEPDQTMVLTLERMPADEPKKVNNLTFTYPGPAPYTYFFRCGAFSQGSSQWSSFGQFVTEFSLKVCDRRVRFVVAYDSTQRYTSALKYVTLICETQPGGTQFKAQSLTINQLLGEWKGVGEVLDPIDGSFREHGGSRWKLAKMSDEGFSLCSEEMLGESTCGVVLESGGAIAPQQPIDFNAVEDGQDYRLMLLSKGAYCFLPREIRQNSEFRIEVGWVSETKVRSRFIRYYDPRGVWTHSALIEDKNTEDENTEDKK